MSKDSSAKYYQNNKERPQKQLVKDIKCFLKKKKKKNMMKDEKQKLVEYRKKYYQMRKNCLIIL